METVPPTDRHDSVPPNQIRLTRRCWYCWTQEVYEYDLHRRAAVSTDGDWIQPCLCNQTHLWIHDSCLQRYIDWKQQGNYFRNVKCPLCNVQYIIDLPGGSLLVDVLKFCDILIDRLYPIPAIYALALPLQTFGYYSLNACDVLEKSNRDFLYSNYPLLTQIGLSAITMCLVLGQWISWDDYIVRCLKNRYRKTHRTVDSAGDDEEAGPWLEIVEAQLGRRRLHQRYDIFTISLNCSMGLLLPSISKQMGRIFFSFITNYLYRTLMGGFLFITAKGYLSSTRSMSEKINGRLINGNYLKGPEGQVTTK